jgi:hypothetical protein
MLLCSISAATHAVFLNHPAHFAQVLIAASRSVTGAIAGQAVGGEPA